MMSTLREHLGQLTQPAIPSHSPLPTLNSSIKCDVGILGGGLTGLLSALLCARSGLSVVLLERDRLGSGESHRSSGQITELLDVPFHQLLKIHGEVKIRLFTESHRSAIHELLEISEARRVPAYLFTEHDHQMGFLREELEALGRLHISSCSQKHTPLPFDVIESLRIENQAWVDPSTLLSRLRELSLKEGVSIFENSPVMEIVSPSPPHIRTIKLRTALASISCDRCIIATHSPILSIHPVHFQMKPQRTYAVSASLKSSLLMEGIYFEPSRSSNGGYHFMNPTSDGVLVGGMDHPVGVSLRPESERLLRLEDYTRARFPVDRFIQGWSGQILESADGLPYLGHALGSDQIWFATGYGGNGVSLAMLSARLIHGKILGTNPELLSLLSPFRLMNRRTWVSLAGNGFRFLEHRALPLVQRHRLPDPNTLAPDEACVGEKRGERVALSRDDQGSLNSVSARCTHLGGELSFNELEKSWDCACHGSRFRRDGSVICGPATAPLRQESLEEEKQAA